MLDYLALERLSYQSENSDIRESFATSATLGAIKPPTLQQEDGSWAIDTNHRFFTDDITTKFKSGIPTVYGMQTIDDVVD